MTQDELKECLRLHALWVKNDPAGSRANLSRANLSRANLSSANLSRAYLSRAYLSRANLSSANLSGAYLSRADLSGANLYGADLSGADLSGANLSGANLSETILAGKAMLSFQFERHFAYFYGDKIRIGCQELSIDEWKNKYEEIGKSNNYTEKQIAAYKDFIDLCEKSKAAKKLML